MIIGIDASNIRGSGGITHLRELLHVAAPQKFGIKEVIVWSGESTLKQLPVKPWLDKVQIPMLDGSLPMRFYWQRICLTKLAKESCDLLFVLGGTYLGGFRPFVTMSQNLLPFDPNESQRYGFSLSRLRLGLLSKIQAITFHNADGVIFLTKKAKQVVEKQIGTMPGTGWIVPHGINPRFFSEPVIQEPLSAYSENRPFRWLYVSKINPYKHQWHVVKAVDHLRKEGIHVVLDLIGPGEHKPSLNRLRKTIRVIDPEKKFVHYWGAVPHDYLIDYYRKADGFVFASSCETFGQILLEAMSSGLPIVCSDRSVMKEILGDSGIYFDPEDPKTIAKAMRLMMIELETREQCALSAYEQSRDYSWERCADETFLFLSKMTKTK